MEIQKERIAELIILYITGGLHEEERVELMKWVDKQEHWQIFRKLTEGEGISRRYNDYRFTNWRKALKEGEKRIGVRRVDWKIGLMRYVVILFLSLGIALAVWWLACPVQQDISLVAEQVCPGCSKAILTLSNGREVVLNEELTGKMEVEENVIVAFDEKRLDYSGKKSLKLEYNNLKTPRGGEYQVVLSDQTVVHLNAGSELRYPVVFDTTKREVYLKGEAWFEVSLNERCPFYVITDEVKIRVYGTRFNVNTLLMNRVQTVLVEGKIGLTLTGESEEYILKPSQLAEYNIMFKKLVVSEVNVLSYVAWKDGLFVFQQERLEDILYKLSLWYNVDFTYEDESIKNIHFSGYLKRYEDISIILNAIQKTACAKFVLKGREIIVLK